MQSETEMLTCFHCWERLINCLKIVSLPSASHSIRIHNSVFFWWNCYLFCCIEPPKCECMTLVVRYCVACTPIFRGSRVGEIIMDHHSVLMFKKNSIHSQFISTAPIAPILHTPPIHYFLVRMTRGIVVVLLCSLQQRANRRVRRDVVAAVGGEDGGWRRIVTSVGE